MFNEIHVGLSEVREAQAEQKLGSFQGASTLSPKHDMWVREGVEGILLMPWQVLEFSRYV